MEWSISSQSAKFLHGLGGPAEATTDTDRAYWPRFFAGPNPRCLFGNVCVMAQFLGGQDWPCDQLQGLELGFKCSAAGGGAVFGGCSHFAPLSSLDWLGGADFQSPDICRQIPDKNPTFGILSGRLRVSFAIRCPVGALALPASACPCAGRLNAPFAMYTGGSGILQSISGRIFQVGLDARPLVFEVGNQRLLFQDGWRWFSGRRCRRCR